MTKIVLIAETFCFRVVRIRSQSLVRAVLTKTGNNRLIANRGRLRLSDGRSCNHGNILGETVKIGRDFRPTVLAAGSRKTPIMKHFHFLDIRGIKLGIERGKVDQIILK